MDKTVPAGAAILLDFLHQADVSGAVAGREGSAGSGGDGGGCAGGEPR